MLKSAPWLTVGTAWPLATLVAGTLDLLYACAVNGPKGAPPLRVMQSVASGLLGRAAFEGGLASALLGVWLHFVILAVAVGLFCAVVARLHVLAAHPVLAGLLAGAVIFAVMNAVVVPLSAAPFRTLHTPWQVARDLLAHMLLVGLPVSLLAARPLR
ncbi:hypothetical protein [Ideonella sp. BN130291]|uniref:hypothetical protein n=1 Tax=Ideonella sp. BN130291 TaxID=3112940 RepID=UPI002E25A6FC|nr:hypothetical protein [Ideonella sp. BN130291]